ncbi:type II secretion system F family protein [Yersinia aleksiciae]|uniref:Putative tight adherance operon protein n=1 Tax=Yersinia aleksiciae TaxID=263819 RepID=A0A0T9U586_YERAE|nr:type II secretion system F family protein [Yersinia aleksiciae]CNL20432.1 putative tight adherance operon protein [Yersinia aleksiciae]
MKIFIFIAIVLLGVIILLRVKSNSNKISIYNRISEYETPQEITGKKKEGSNQSKDLSDFIHLPFILHNVVYLKFFIIAISLMIVTIFFVTNTINLSLNSSIIIGLTILLVTLYLPKLIMKNVIARRTESVLKSLPFFIDITAACVQSGMTIDSSLSYTAQKFKLINPDLSLIMNKMAKRAEINGLESAIKELHQCSTKTEMRMFCSTLQYSISFGSSVYDQLIKLSQDIREMQLLVTEEKISKLSTKLTIPLFIFIVIPFIVLVISPSILELISYVQNN